MKDAFSKKAKTLFNDIRTTTAELMDDMDRQLKIAVNHAVKSFISATITVLGLIFALVGISKYLESQFNILSDGLGFVVVGLAIIIIGFITMKVKVSIDN